MAKINQCYIVTAYKLQITIASEFDKKFTDKELALMAIEILKKVI